MASTTPRNPLSPDDGLDLLLAPLGREAFFAEYWERRPLVLRATPERRAALAVAGASEAAAAAAAAATDRDVLNHSPHTNVLRAPACSTAFPHAYSPACDFAELVRRASDPTLPKLRWGLDVNAARTVPRRNGRAVERQTPNAGGRGDPVDPRDLWDRFAPPPPSPIPVADGRVAHHGGPRRDEDDRRPSSYQLMQPQRWSGALWRLASALEAQLGSLVGINSYITPPGAQGLAPHWDDVEVLVVQTRGAKKWHLRSLGGGDKGVGGGGGGKANGKSSTNGSKAQFDARLSLPSTPSGDLPLSHALSLGRFAAKELFADALLGKGDGKAASAAAAAGSSSSGTTTTKTKTAPPPRPTGYQGADVDANGLVTTVTLYPGDMLYMPRGTVHWAEAVDSGGSAAAFAAATAASPRPPASVMLAEAHKRACGGHSAHLTISTYQRWTYGDLLMYLLDGTLHRPTGAAPPHSGARGAAALPLELRRSPKAGFAFACGLEAGGGSSNGAQALLKGLKEAVSALAKRIDDDACRDLALGAGRRMAAADFWGFRLPPHPSQLWPRGPAPDLSSRLAWRAGRWATVLPVGGAGAGGEGEGGGGNKAKAGGGGARPRERSLIKVVSCLDNRRENHMVPPPPEAEGQEEEEDEDEDEEDEDEEDGSGSGSETGSGSESGSGSGSGSDDESNSDSDSDSASDFEEDVAAAQDPSDPISALPGVIMPGHLLPAIRQLVQAAAAIDRAPAGPAGGRRPPSAEQAAVPLRALEGLRGEDERLRLAYSLWAAGLVSVLPVAAKKSKQGEDTKKRWGGPVGGGGGGGGGGSLTKKRR